MSTTVNRPNTFNCITKQKQHRETLKYPINPVFNVHLPGLHAEEVGQLHKIQIITQVRVYFWYFYLYSGLWDRLFFLLFLTQSILILMKTKNRSASGKSVFGYCCSNNYILLKEKSSIGTERSGRFE